MALISCLAGLGPEKVAMFIAVLKRAGVPIGPSVASLNVVELARLAPELLVCDVDELVVDRLEMLRQLRFVLPACIIIVYTVDGARTWAISCHLAGANGVLSKASTRTQLVAGVRSARRNGCFTDPRFAAA
jgi:DNA-binding NarL/FixJ family response regulator